MTQKFKLSSNEKFQDMVSSPSRSRVPELTLAPVHNARPRWRGGAGSAFVAAAPAQHARFMRAARSHGRPKAFAARVMSAMLGAGPNMRVVEPVSRQEECKGLDVRGPFGGADESRIGAFRQRARRAEQLRSRRYRAGCGSARWISSS